MNKETILQVVSEVTGVSKEDILSGNKTAGTRKAEIVFARYLSIAYCKLYNTGSIAEIMAFHNRSLSYCTHVVKTLKNDIETDKAKWWTYFYVTTALAKIESLPKPVRTLPAITEDLSDDEYQDLTSEALKFQTNMTNIIV